MDASDGISRLEHDLLAFDRVAASSLLKNLSRELSPRELMDEIVVPALESIGRGWENGTVALTQVYISGLFIEKFIDSRISPADPNRITRPKMAIAVLEDHHFLGKRIVYAHLRASGYELKDYGGVTADSLVDLVKRDGIRILLISVLMLPSALRIKDVRARLRSEGLETRILVGGAPFRFDEKLWREVGADGMARTADEGVAWVRRAVETLS